MGCSRWTLPEEEVWCQRLESERSHVFWAGVVQQRVWRADPYCAAIRTPQYRAQLDLMRVSRVQCIPVCLIVGHGWGALPCVRRAAPH